MVGLFVVGVALALGDPEPSVAPFPLTFVGELDTSYVGSCLIEDASGPLVEGDCFSTSTFPPVGQRFLTASSSTFGLGVRLALSRGVIVQQLPGGVMEARFRRTLDAFWNNPSASGELSYQGVFQGFELAADRDMTLIEEFATGDGFGSGPLASAIVGGVLPAGPVDLSSVQVPIDVTVAPDEVPPPFDGTYTYRFQAIDPDELPLFGFIERLAPAFLLDSAAVFDADGNLVATGEASASAEMGPAFLRVDTNGGIDDFAAAATSLQYVVEAISPSSVEVIVTESQFAEWTAPDGYTGGLLASGLAEEFKIEVPHDLRLVERTLVGTTFGDEVIESLIEQDGRILGGKTELQKLTISLLTSVDAGQAPVDSQSEVRYRFVRWLDADATRDGVVDLADLFAVISTWGLCIDSEDCPTDLDGDGLVGISDLMQVFREWGS